MNALSSISPGFSAGDADLDVLKRSGGDASKEVAEKFEGLFVSMLLKTMRESMTSGEMFGGDQSDVFGGLFDQFMGDALAQSGGLGLMNQLTESAAPGSAFSSLL